MDQKEGRNDFPGESRTTGKIERSVSINDRSIFYPGEFHLETWTTMPAAINCAAFYRSSVFILPPPPKSGIQGVSKRAWLDSTRFLSPEILHKIFTHDTPVLLKNRFVSDTSILFKNQLRK